MEVKSKLIIKNVISHVKYQLSNWHDPELWNYTESALQRAKRLKARHKIPSYSQVVVELSILLIMLLRSQKIRKGVEGRAASVIIVCGGGHTLAKEVGSICEEFLGSNNSADAPLSLEALLVGTAFCSSHLERLRAQG